MARAGLDREAVVTAAATLADTEGLEAVTLAKVAAQLGVKSPSLYVHVDGLAGLRREIAARGAREVTGLLQAAVAGRAGRDALAALADAYRSYARAHPGTYAAIQNVTNLEGPAADAATAALDVFYAVLRGYALDDEAAIHAARIVRSALHGFVSLEVGSGFGIDLDLDESFARLVDVLDRGLSAR
ncbi:WHG domain-containing protein [Solirubrobacter phytolaccae]|uniref:WHG domain-containing protein n=1 Tax=Solirubrobacter phytolaccae TaxID=1404360 RepID=A0A9X3N8C6_9ACTN|nr:TetR/AcrR family transcriptional regulator [Solirubrobacter phytolaccae]MDA0180112.1 WHG domain-containing protein [Solirubrobacter phytolaccae]